ncbi:MAG TPA: pyruvate kinase [Saprospiraceae bacterium]|nr:pyruvate kinase [Saprospiraceae bacterium]
MESINITKRIKKSLKEIESSMVNEVEKRSSILSEIHTSQLMAAKNMLHYLTLRKEDIRALQNDLHSMGLSSLASAESHIRSQLQAINQRLGKRYKVEDEEICSFEWCQANIAHKSKKLFGERDNDFVPSLMVTFDTSFATNYALIKSLLLNGMNVARINCAHDDEAVWSGMISKLKKACFQTGKACKIYMDLAGPKIRTNIILKGEDKGRVKVKEGQLIWLSYDTDGFDKKEVVISPTEPDIIACIKKGDRVYIDDGMIRGVTEKVKKDKVAVRITRISSEKKVIKNEKGINFPDSELNVSPLTSYDISCLPFICENADLVGYSFVRLPSDLTLLRNLMTETSERQPNIVIKIETPEAVKHLPSILLEGMKQDIFGIMIARGDLAVEIGFERMGEIQEEILWICEAAHVPVIWATQVLENLNKSGLATRSEITDAVNAAQAECIMINKGSHTIEVMETLRDILQRASEHRNKKRFTFRSLNIAKNFLALE